MAVWKMPPKAKVYEALSAVGDDRVRLTGSGQANVTSSAGTKTYVVEWSGDVQKITSNDNASYWQGYVGYPIIATLFLLGKIDFTREVAQRLQGIPWNELNKRFKRDYDKAIDYVLQEVEAKGGNREAVVQEVDKIFEQLHSLGLERLPRRKSPPKGQT